MIVPAGADLGETFLVGEGDNCMQSSQAKEIRELFLCILQLEARLLPAKQRNFSGGLTVLQATLTIFTVRGRGPKLAGSAA